ncbi:hypothetical protein MXB_4400 [Myxobolus squamalis]|nr:hypothetical protein MXB_4400 [Myxobolus squamalis]
MRSCKFFFKRLLLLLLLILLYQQFSLLYYSVILIPVGFQKVKITNKSLEAPKEISKSYPDHKISEFYDYFPSRISLEKSFKNYLLRQDIRNSYGKNNVLFKYAFENEKLANISHCFLFSIGYRDDLVINQQVDFESFTHRDIVRVPIYDEYRKTANKIILTLYLLDQMEIPFKFVLKTDDDIFLKINKIIPLLHNLKDDNVFIGHVVHNSIPIRDSSNKWYVSKEDYPSKYYKPYLMGSCYIFRRTIIDTIAKKHYTVPLIPMEDIHVSYLVTGSGYYLSDSRHFYHCNSFYQCKDSYIVDMGRNLFRRKYIMSRFKQDFAYYNRTYKLLDYEIMAEY